jgi:alkaline phosphatase D
VKKLNRRTFVVSSSALSASLSAGGAFAENPATATEWVGPMVGHVDSHQAWLWLRAEVEGYYKLKLLKEGREVASQIASPSPARDYCMTWHFAELEPNTKYEYQIAVSGSADAPFVVGEDYFFETPAEPETPAKTVLAFGSCAKTEPLKLWTQMAESDIEGVVLLGDTPYIDSTELEVQRRKHCEFLQIPELARLIRSRPVWGTWDDHDFGMNNSDGTLPGKENARQAFLEYRAHASQGHDDQGIYTSFRRGGDRALLARHPLVCPHGTIASRSRQADSAGTNAVGVVVKWLKEIRGPLQDHCLRDDLG